jgi:serine protease Do
MIKVPARFPLGIEARSRSLPRRCLAVPAGIAALVVLCFGQGVVPEPGFTSKAHAQAMTRPVGFADIVDKVKPAVISVRVNIVAGRQARGNSPFPQDSPLDRFFRRFGVPDGTPDNSQGQRRNRVTGQGSGFFISADGYAVTNFHVVENTDSVEVTTDDGRIFKAKVIGADQRSDIALIKIDGGGGFPFVRFAEASPRIGDWVIAVGNPFGLGGSVTAGIVSARGRDIGAGPYDDFIQIDAAVNRGSSGGPSFDVEGNVIGVNTAIVSPTGGSVGIAFAIPAEIAKSVVTQLREKGKVTRGWIGVQIQEITPGIAENLGLKSARGALVAEPQADGPAVKAGIEAGDVIVAINGKEVGDSREVARTISALPPATSVKLTVMRKGQEKTVNIVLGNLPDQREASVAPEGSKQRGATVPRLGLAVAPQTGGEGVVVTNVDPDGLAAEQGFQTGDVILQAAGKKVANAVDLRTAMEAAQKAGKHTVLLRVKTGDGIKFVAVPVGRS